MKEESGLNRQAEGPPQEERQVRQAENKGTAWPKRRRAAVSREGVPKPSFRVKAKYPLKG